MPTCIITREHTPEFSTTNEAMSMEKHVSKMIRAAEKKENDEAREAGIPWNDREWGVKQMLMGYFHPETSGSTKRVGFLEFYVKMGSKERMKDGQNKDYKLDIDTKFLQMFESHAFNLSLGDNVVLIDLHMRIRTAFLNGMKESAKKQNKGIQFKIFRKEDVKWQKNVVNFAVVAKVNSKVKDKASKPMKTAMKAKKAK